MKEPVPRNMESVAHGEAGDMDTAVAVRPRDLVLIPPGSEVLVATFELNFDAPPHTLPSLITPSADCRWFTGTQC